MIADGNKKFENGMKQLDDLIGENCEKISSLIITTGKIENDLKLHDKSIGEIREKIENMNITTDYRLYGLETNVNKIQVMLAALEGEIKKLLSRINYLDRIMVEDSTIGFNPNIAST